MRSDSPPPDSWLHIGMSVTFLPFERWTSDLATGFQTCEQQIKIQHSALRPERVQNCLSIEWR